MSIGPLLVIGFLPGLLFFCIGIYLLHKHNWDNGFFEDKFAFTGVLCSINGALLCMAYFIFSLSLFFTEELIGLFLSVLLLLGGLGIFFFRKYDRQKNFTNDIFGVLSAVYFSTLFFLMLTPFALYIFFYYYGFSLYPR
jgi:hypothetical protein